MPSNFISGEEGGDLDAVFITEYEIVDRFIGGKLWSCGYNLGGQLGLSTTATKSSITQSGLLTNWKQISCGSIHFGAIKTDGTLWTCGYNTNGQLGLGDTVSRSSPVQVGALTNWQQVSGGRKHFLAVKNNGTLWGCGYNTQGQMGQGNVTAVSSPVQVGTLTNWKQVAGSFLHVVSVKTDGTLWGWGYNNLGQLGLGDVAVSRSSPVQIGVLTNWKQVSGGFAHTAAIKTDGTLWIWGSNYSGQLGLGDITPDRSSPTQVGTMTNWKSVACGYHHTAAIKTDGTLWAWGYDSWGQLGASNTTPYSSPVQIGSLSNWKQVACGYQMTMAVKTDGTLWAWGYNASGQLGTNNTNGYSSPVQVGSLTSWKQVASSMMAASPTNFSAAIDFETLN